MKYAISLIGMIGVLFLTNMTMTVSTAIALVVSCGMAMAGVTNEKA